MDKRFKWNMLITSFIPLWVSIIISDMWDIVIYVVSRWKHLLNLDMDFKYVLFRFLKANGLMISSIMVISIVVVISIVDIKLFIRAKEKEGNSPVGRLLRITRANKLSAEFLLAYILPLIAFDFSDAKGVALFVLYFCVLAFLCIRNNNIYTNIYLEIKKFRMYECDVECRVANGSKVYKNSLVLSRRDLTTRTDGGMRYWDFDNYIYIDLDQDGKNSPIKGGQST